mmetsp:Transcript_1515/g.1868  ORF Transcript_1515/g.1868 Transcript_1515/m.1868 type:complete len:192 (+) Transcript_1515:1-576(+)
MAVKPVYRILCACDDCRDFVRYSFSHAKKPPNLHYDDYVDPYGSIDVVSFYKNDVVICEGEDLIETYSMVKGSGYVRIMAGCCSTPLFSSHSLLPTLEILAPNIDPEDLMRIEKPCHRIMTKFALFPAPKTPTPSSGFGLWYWSVILQQLFCCCHYYTKRNRDPVPYSKDGPVLVDRARLKKVKIMFDDAK